MRIDPFRALFAFTMSTTNNNSSSNASSNAKGTASSVWPTIELPLNPAVQYDDNHVVQAVESLLNYCDDHVTHMQTRRDLGGTDSALEGASWIAPRVMIRNARLDDRGNLLDRHGFQLVSHHPLSTAGSATKRRIDFTDSDDVIDHYYPLCEQLLKETLSNTANLSPPPTVVRAFDHNVRVSGSQSRDEQGTTVLQQPVGVVHNDYTHVSAPRRLEQLAQPPKANDALKTRLLENESLLDPVVVQEVVSGQRRFAFVNVWRNMDEHVPVQQFPLACASAMADDARNLLTFQIIYKDRIGENYFARFSHRHQWNYFPQMSHDEALLIKQWDSHGTLAQQEIRKEEDGRTTTTVVETEEENANFMSTFSLHSAFQDPTSPKDAPPRQSIEVRCVLIWDKEE